MASTPSRRDEEETLHIEHPVPEDPLQPYSIYPNYQKRLFAWAASMAAFSSPVSSNIYYPALSALARDLNTSLSNINLTITTFMICQAIAPTFMGGISDRWGRRPALIICFIIYIAANTGLALQTSFPALLILRMVQSSGASGTGAISSGVVSDVATRAERGSYVGLAALGQTLGPTLGPLIGGLLIHFKGWRSTFWFLDIYAGVIILVFLLLIPETCRNIVGNGSVPPQKWNFSLIAYIQQRRRRKRNLSIAATTISNRRRTALLASLPIIASRESFLLLIFGGIMYAGYYIILTGLPQQLESTFNYNSIQVGLCYIPMGFGAIVARQVTGRAVDWNFRRHGKRLGIVILKSRQTNIDQFPVERARLEIAIPLAYLSCVVIVPYGWIMNMHQPPLPAALVLLFFTAFSLSGAFQCLQVLMIDCYPDSPSSATAANNLIRCVLGAGAVTLVEPLLRTFGRGWTGTFIAATEACFSLCWWAVYIWGPGWRKQRRERRAKLDEKHAQKSEEKAAKDAIADAFLVPGRTPKSPT